MIRQRDKWGPPGQYPAPPLQHSRRQHLHLAVGERVNQPQEGDEAAREDLEEDHDQPVWGEEAARARGDTLGQGARTLLVRGRPR